jgi:hypothetical protein
MDLTLVCVYFHLLLSITLQPQNLLLKRAKIGEMRYTVLTKSEFMPDQLIYLVTYFVPILYKNALIYTHQSCIPLLQAQPTGRSQLKPRTSLMTELYAAAWSELSRTS